VIVEGLSEPDMASGHQISVRDCSDIAHFMKDSAGDTGVQLLSLFAMFSLVLGFLNSGCVPLVATFPELQQQLRTF